MTLKKYWPWLLAILRLDWELAQELEISEKLGRPWDRYQI